MKKISFLIILGTFISILGMGAEQRVTIKPGSYCDGLKYVLGSEDYDHGDNTDAYEIYLFGKCVINGKIYRSKTVWIDEDTVGSRLQIYFDNFQQSNNITNKITKKNRVYFIPGQTMVKETDYYVGEVRWKINVKKIQIK